MSDATVIAIVLGGFAYLLVGVLAAIVETIREDFGRTFSHDEPDVVFFVILCWPVYYLWGVIRYVLVKVHGWSSWWRIRRNREIPN